MKSEIVGKHSDGSSVVAYTLKNGRGMEMRVMTLGGIVTHLWVPDRSGVPGDITLGLPTLKAYLEGHPYFGAIVGRVAGRMTGGVFEADGVRHQLDLNDGPNHLHGGVLGLDKKNWSAEPLGDAGLRLSCVSPDGESGYPGNLSLEVTYLLTEDNAWTIDYRATTDRTTPVSLTQHAYFNLAGEASRDIRDHLMEIQADTQVPAEDDFTLTGREEPVGKADLRKPRRLGEVLDAFVHQHGSNYRLGGTKGPRLAARVVEQISGRIMEVFTDATDLQLYTGSHLSGNDIGKSGKPYPPFSGFCLECQGYPSGVNGSPLGDILLHPGQTYHQSTSYRFSIQ